MNTKIKVTLGRIVDSEIRVMHQGQPVIAGYRFMSALEKLCDDPLPVKVKYAVGKTHKQVVELVKLYDKRRAELIEEHGTKQSELHRRERVEVVADMSAPEHVKAKRLERLDALLADLEKNPSKDTIVIPMGDDAAYKKYEDGLKADREEEHELFLNERVTLPEGTKLSGIEMMAIEELITV